MGVTGISARAVRLVGAVVVAAAGAAMAVDAATAASVPATRAPAMFSTDEVSLILQHGPWPPKSTPDPSNRVAGSAAAARFGAQLFFDPRLSTSGTIACASCHMPELGWSDGRPTARGLGDTDRNSRSLMDARFNRWFGWAGATDSLWAASLRPLADPLEMGRADRHVPALVREQPDLACNYTKVFGHAPSPTDDDRVLSDVGKVLAAFQAQLVSGRTPFDNFRDALARGDRKAQARYPEDAQRGLKLFIGRAQCNLCHLGPQFSNGEFDKVGISVRRPDGRIDWGRYDGIKALQASRFSLLGRFNDDPKRAEGQSTRHVALTRENYGQFRVPSLRNVEHSAPYMHDGSLPTLTDVVRHYSTIDAVKLHLAMPHAHGDPGEDSAPPPTVTFPRTLDLTESEIADLVAFLRSLSERNSRPFVRPTPPPACR